MTLQISSQPAITAGTVIQKEVFGLVKMATSKSTFYMPGSSEEQIVPWMLEIPSPHMFTEQ